MAISELRREGRRWRHRWRRRRPPKEKRIVWPPSISICAIRAAPIRIRLIVPAVVSIRVESWAIGSVRGAPIKKPGDFNDRIGVVAVIQWTGLRTVHRPHHGDRSA